MENKLPEFKDAQSLRESATIIASASCFLRIAQGEVCSLNTRVKPTFEGKDAENLLKSFDKVFKFLKRGYDGFVEGVKLAEASAGSSGSHS